MAEEKDQKQPLLYIVQPSLSKPQARMQERFVIKSEPEKKKRRVRQFEAVRQAEQEVEWREAETLYEESEESIVAIVADEPTVVAAATEAVLEPPVVEEVPIRQESAAETRILDQLPVEEESADEEETEEEEEQDAGNWRIKPFRDMTNEEKLEFLVNRPHYIPKVKCQVKTTHDTFTGYIISFENGIARMRDVMRARDVYVRIGEISSIRMIGL